MSVGEPRFAFEGRLDNRRQLAARLAVDPALPDAALAAAAWLSKNDTHAARSVVDRKPRTTSRAKAVYM